MDDMNFIAGHKRFSRHCVNSPSLVTRSTLCLCALIIGASCSAKVTGPAPAIERPGPKTTPAPVDPAIVCRAQLTTEVKVSGERFSPVPIDIPKHPGTALPDISLTKSSELEGKEASRADQILYSGDPDKDPTNAYTKDGDTPLISWDSQKSMTFVVNQNLTLSDGSKGMLEEGVYDVSVVNPDHKSAESPGALAVVDKPALQKITPPIICLDEQERSVQLSGSRFLRIGEAKSELEIEGVDEPFALALDECTKIKHEGIDAEFCPTATVSLPKQSVAVGYPSLVVHNPKTAACISEETVNLRVVPKPTVDRAVPVLGCVAENARGFEIQGSGLLRIDDAVPAVQVGGKDFAVDSMDGCKSLETMGLTVETCSSIKITIAKDALAPNLYDVLVTNPQPAGCSQTAVGALRIVPPPTVTSVDPPLICVDESDQYIVVKGSDFITIDGTVPAVKIGSVTIEASKISALECSELTTPRQTVRSCKQLAVTVARGSLPQGLYDLSVTNPDPAGCTDTGSNVLRVVASPEVTAVTPALVCTDDVARDLVITGAGFLKVDGVLPGVFFGLVQATVNSASNCIAIDVGSLKVESCTALNIRVAKGALAEGRPEVTVMNPPPASCSTGNSSVLTVPPDVTITSVTPSNICTLAGNTQVTIQGTGFLRIDSSDFELRIGGAVVMPDRIDDCTALTAVGMTVQSCKTVTATVSPSALSAGDVPIAITNPAPSGCGASASSLLRIVLPPDVTGVAPAHVCSDVNTVVTVTGTGFVTGATVRIGETAASNVQVNSATELVATFSSGVPADTYDVTVDNGVGCGDTLVDAITVDPTPIVFFVDPPVVYNDVAIQGTIFTTGLAAAATKVELVNSSNTATELTFASPKRFNRIQAAIPGNEALTPGQYEVRVTSNVGCVGFLPGGLTVTNSLTVGDLTIEPAYASPTKPTAVTITATVGTGDAGFRSVPRVYLNPTAAASTAMALRAVVMVSDTKMTAVIPEGMTSGTYDLIVVNPSGEVGLLANGVTITGAEPPVVENVVPASLVPNTATTVTVTGTGFDVDSVALECKASPTATTVTNVSGTIVGTPTATQVQASFNPGASGVNAGSICLLNLANQDGGFFEYSAVSLTNSSLNLSPWSPSPMSLSTGRRALSLVAGRPTATSRFLYAIGGDSGVSGTGNQASIGSTVFNNVEAANVDVYGNMGSWAVQTRTPLPVARTWAGAATIGRFIYLVGGHNGTGATDTLYRAQVLDPLAGPEIADLDAELGDGVAGLGGGLWLYRVAAVYRTSDASNPGGESMAGDILNVQLPNHAKKIKLKLTWTQVTGASGYRIYRSPAANGSVDNLQLLGTVTCGADTACDCSANPEKCQFSDDGQTATAAPGPLPAGALGVWHAVDGARCTSGDCLLGSAREALGVVAVRNPSDSSKYFLYAVGGRNASGTYLNTYEVATVTVVGDGSQTVADWVAGSDVLASARAELGIWPISAENSSIIRTSGTPTDVWIYVGGGRNTGGIDQTLEVGKVGAGGDLGTFSTTNITALKSNITGFGAGASNDRLYTFGGSPTAADGSSANVCSGAGGGCPGGVPDLPNNAWNSLGDAQTSRIYMGATQESAFYFMAGGWFNGAPLSSTEQTVQ